jgi:hypothetical protein
MMLRVMKIQKLFLCRFELSNLDAAFLVGAAGQQGKNCTPSLA